jgi:hypothetical protein
MEEVHETADSASLEAELAVRQFAEAQPAHDSMMPESEMGE